MTEAAGPTPALGCIGEEPFWRIDVIGERATFTTPDGAATLSGGLERLDWLSPGWLVWRGRLAGGSLALVVRTEECHSTMADTPPLTHRALLLRDQGPVSAGCCTVTTAAERR
jgi:uncharacterized membrane protein